MDIFSFKNPTAPTLMEQGEIVNKLDSKLWIERYAQAGEFEFTGKASSGVRDKLPIGSFVSHTGSTEIMVVENHEISDERGRESEITISGRGFETIFDTRIVGANKAFPTNNGVTDFTLAAASVQAHAVSLITQHAVAGSLVSPGDAIPYMTVINEVLSNTPSETRTFKRGTLYSRLLETLAISNLGIRVIRPGPWSPNPSSPDVHVAIHEGVNRTAKVIFSYDTGEIESADYLWTNKKLRNTAIVTGRWVETLVTTTATGVDRRMMHVDASDIDNALDAAPTGTALTDIVNKMQQRGIQALAAQKNVAITKAEVSKTAHKLEYRKDFNVGDLITVSGDYNESSVMRISEFVEIEDSTGERAYPTLSKD